MKNSSADFAAWLTRELTARGYDVTNTRSGARSRFAEDSGISQSTVSRLLRGQSGNDIGTFAALANALGLSLGEVLVRAGIITRQDLAGVQRPATTRRITPEQAADELGIEDDQARRLFVGMVETLQRTPPPTERRADQ